MDIRTWLDSVEQIAQALKRLFGVENPTFHLDFGTLVTTFLIQDIAPDSAEADLVVESVVVDKGKSEESEEGSVEDQVSEEEDIAEHLEPALTEDIPVAEVEPEHALDLSSDEEHKEVHKEVHKEAREEEEDVGPVRELIIDLGLSIDRVFMVFRRDEEPIESITKPWAEAIPYLENIAEDPSRVIDYYYNYGE